MLDVTTGDGAGTMNATNGSFGAAAYSGCVDNTGNGEAYYGNRKVIYLVMPQPQFVALTPQFLRSLTYSNGQDGVLKLIMKLEKQKKPF